MNLSQTNPLVYSPGTYNLALIQLCFGRHPEYAWRHLIKHHKFPDYTLDQSLSNYV